MNRDFQNPPSPAHPAPSPAVRAQAAFTLIWGVSIRLILAIGSLYLLYRFRYVLITVLMAAILALVLDPIVEAVCGSWSSWSNARTKRFLVTLVVFLLVFALAGYIQYILLVPFRIEVGRLLQTMDVRHGAIHDYMVGVQAWYRGLPPDVQDFVTGQASLIGPRLAEALRTTLRTTFEWLGHVVELITIPVLAFYFVLDSRSLKREFLFLVPRRRVRDALVVLEESALILRAYVTAQIILCLIAAVVVGIGLHLLGVRYALTLSILAGITRAIPILGPILGGIPIVVIAALQSVESGVAVLIFFSLLHIVESKLITPKLLGDRLHLHPAVILIVLLMGAEFFGVLGMFLAVPVAALLKVLFDYYMLGRRRTRRRRAAPALAAGPEARETARPGARRARAGRADGPQADVPRPDAPRAEPRGSKVA